MRAKHKEAGSTTAKEPGSTTARIQLTIIPERKKQTAVLFADYDNCFDVLFWEWEEKIRAIDPNLLPLFYRYRGELRGYLKNITANMNVILVIASTRQSIKCDKEAHVRNQNGLCFENYVKLCEEMGWTLCKKLYTDTVNSVPSGTAFEREDLDFEGNLDKRLLFEDMFGEVTNMFAGERELVGYIFDDLLDDVLYPVKAHFEADGNVHKLPPNAYFTLVNFNWFKHFKTGVFPKDGIIREIGYLRGSRELSEQELKADFLDMLQLPLGTGTPRRSPRKSPMRLVSAPINFNFIQAFMPPSQTLPVPDALPSQSLPVDPTIASPVTATQPVASLPVADPVLKPTGVSRLFCCCREKPKVIEDAANDRRVSPKRSHGKARRLRQGL